MFRVRMDISVNYLAVLVAAIANMAVGMAWYGPLFGKQWMALMGFTPESMKSMKMTASQAMTGGFVTALIMAYVLAHFVAVWSPFDVGDAFQLAFWIWLGFVATTQAGSVLWEGKPAKLFTLNAAASLITLFVMTLILTYWV